MLVTKSGYSRSVIFSLLAYSRARSYGILMRSLDLVVKSSGF